MNQQHGQPLSTAAPHEVPDPVFAVLCITLVCLVTFLGVRLLPPRLRAIANTVAINRQLLGEGHSHAIMYFGGPVQHSPQIYLLFWQPAGTTFEPGGSDEHYEQLIIRYEQDVPGTSYLGILDQYTDAGTGRPVGPPTLAGAFIITDPFPDGGDIQAELQLTIARGRLPASIDTQYVLFLPAEVALTAGFGCAYHNAFSGNTGLVVYAVIPDGAARGCSPTNAAGQPLAPNDDRFADAAMYLLSHEQAEMLTDPLPSSQPAWTTVSSGLGEVGDPCAWTTGFLAADGSNVVLRGHPYILQPLWSDAAGGCVLSGP